MIDPEAFAATLSGVGDPIAARSFEIAHPDGTTDELTLTFGRPLPLPDGDGAAWYCPWQLSGAAGARIRCIFGVDSLQALLLALQLASAELEGSTEARAGRLTWLGEPDLGLAPPPVPAPAR